jgi:amino-acid N-acetyltransferase
MNRPRVTLRTACVSEAPTLHALVSENQEEGHLLPRSLGEITIHAERFVVAARGSAVVGCSELAPLSAQTAEVRSLAVGRGERGNGVGVALVDELRRRARRAGYERLCAFTHDPRYFAQMGFSIVPHAWLAEKMVVDCCRCLTFQRCGQYAMLVGLDRSPQRDEARQASSRDLVRPMVPA